MEKIRANNGSRFNVLNEEEDEESNEAGATEMETGEGRSVDAAPKTTEVVDKGKRPAVVEVDDMDGVELSASDPGLIDGVGSTTKPSGGKTKEANKSISGRIMERVALKEVSNTLEAQPVNFKPNRNGLGKPQGPVIGPVSEWPLLCNIKNGTGDNTKGPVEDLCSAPTHARPADLSRELLRSKSLDRSQTTREIGDGGRKEETLREFQAEAMDHDVEGGGEATAARSTAGQATLSI